MQDKSLHIYIGIAFALFLMLHIIRRCVTGFDALMKKGDVKEGLHIIKSFFVKKYKDCSTGQVPARAESSIYILRCALYFSGSKRHK